MLFTINRSLFLELADVAAQNTLPFFRKSIVIDNKDSTGFDPVTIADQQTEKALRHFIRSLRPQDGILGEEEGGEGLNQEYVWVIDPIDGTRAFISGLPVWGTLIGILKNGDAVAGMMAQPYIGELFYANSEGSFLLYNHVLKKLSTRKTTALKDAILFSTAPSLFEGEKKEAFSKLENLVKLTRYGVDCYAFSMLAAGHVDLVVEVGLKPYDIVALIPLIEKAGGVITQWDGSPAEKGGNIIAAATPELHKLAMEVLIS